MAIHKHVQYFAGIIDGEGCFCISKARYKKDHANDTYRLVLSVTNTSLVLINWLYSNFGGLIYKRKVYNPKWKQRHDWIMPMNRMDNLLEDLKGKLIIKSKQLDVAIKFRSTFSEETTGKKISPEILKIRGDCRNEMNRLNKKGNASVETIYGAL